MTCLLTPAGSIMQCKPTLLAFSFHFIIIYIAAFRDDFAFLFILEGSFFKLNMFTIYIAVRHFIHAAYRLTLKKFVSVFMCTFYA